MSSWRLLHGEYSPAQQEFLQWRDVPASDRVQVLYRYKALVEQNLNALARLVCEESGKTIDQ